MSQNVEGNPSGLTRSQLCQFASDLCAEIKAQVGDAGYRGGIYAGNVTRNEDGSVKIGAAGEGVLRGNELLYTAPELYWNGKRTPAGDVYSVGLLLYYMSEGRLPFESESCNPRKAQQYRMQGNAFNPPVNAGRRLGDIIVKALSFDREKRYRNVGEMKIMLDNCMKNLFLSEEPCAETVFKKDDDSLSEMERIMVSIIEGHDDLAEDIPEEALNEEAALLPVELDNESHEQHEEQADLGFQSDASEEQANSDKMQNSEGASTTEAEPESIAAVKDPQALDDDGADSQSTEFTAEDSEVPEAEESESYTEKLKPVSPDAVKADLEPVRVKHKKTVADDFPDISVTTDGVAIDSQNAESLAELRKRKRRPLLFILLLCAILILAAIVFNVLTEVPEIYTEPEETPEITDTNSEPEEQESGQEPEASPEPVEEPQEEIPVVSTYEIIMSDVSWLEAQRLCENRGGHLVVINDMDEYLRVTSLLEEYTADYAWIGMSRENGNLEWVTGENAEELYCKWAKGEPSEYDGDIPEDYVLMWNNGGWRYNDCVNDPASQYDWYRGNILYICEVETPAGQ